MLAWLGRAAYTRRWLVLVAWVVLTGGLLVLSAAAGGTFRTTFDLPGSESQAAVDIMSRGGFVGRTGESGAIVFSAQQGVDDARVRREMGGLFARVGALKSVSIPSPYADGASGQVSEDGTIAFAELAFAPMSQEEYSERADRIRALGG